MQEKYKKVRQEILNRWDSNIYHGITKKLHNFREDRLERRFMSQVVNSVKKNKIVNLTGYNAVQMPFAFRTMRYLEDIFGEKIISLKFRFHENVPAKHLENIIVELTEMVDLAPTGLIIFENVQCNTPIRELLRYTAGWHCLLTSETLLVEIRADEYIHIGGKGFKLVVRLLRKVMIGEKNGWETHKPRPYYWASIYKSTNFFRKPVA